MTVNIHLLYWLLAYIVCRSLHNAAAQWPPYTAECTLQKVTKIQKSATSARKCSEIQIEKRLRKQLASIPLSGRLGGSDGGDLYRFHQFGTEGMSLHTCDQPCKIVTWDMTCDFQETGRVTVVSAYAQPLVIEWIRSFGFRWVFERTAPSLEMFAQRTIG